MAGRDLHTHSSPPYPQPHTPKLLSSSPATTTRRPVHYFIQEIPPCGFCQAENTSDEGVLRSLIPPPPPDRCWHLSRGVLRGGAAAVLPRVVGEGGGGAEQSGGGGAQIILTNMHEIQTTFSGGGNFSDGA